MPQQEWSIGIYAGTSPHALAAPPQVQNPVLTRQQVSDVPAAFVADPFMLRVHNIWYMFFEVLNRHTDKGEIGLAISDNGMHWQYQGLVLREPFHLSYPYVFAWLGDYYMIPETYQASAVRLYKAAPFPAHWSCVATLLHGPYFADSSLFRHGEMWWLFTETSSDMRHDTLRLYYANDLPGPWREHPASPVVAQNPHMARPAGRVLMDDGRIIRYTQDCYPVYGTQVRAFEVTELTTMRYHEQALAVRPVLSGSGTGWNASGMHHLDPHRLDAGRWLACVDGFFWSEEPPYSRL
jgi:hypothetical protein